MKVLDLQCANGHAFEGWFASESDFVFQRERNLVQCPVCSDPAVTKKISAPRLNLSNPKVPGSEIAEKSPEPAAPSQALTAVWFALARQVVANTTDVGDRFATEARKMHYGETQEKAIRGQTTLEEAQELADEGIEVMPFILPEAFKEPLQ
jgi:hypothetical protein